MTAAAGKTIATQAAAAARPDSPVQPSAPADQAARLFGARLALRREKLPPSREPLADGRPSAPATRPMPAHRSWRDSMRAAYGDDDRKGEGSGLTAPALQQAVAAPLPVPLAAATALGVEPGAAAEIVRMASAIAAALTRGDEPVFTVRFNGASSLAEAALVVREPGGAVSIRMEGAAPMVAPVALEAELRTALDRRRVRLGRVEWGGSLHDSRKLPKRFAESGAGPDGS